MNNVVRLPTAAQQPVENPRWRGRYPSSVLVIPYVLRRLRMGSEAIVTTGINRGVRCKVLFVKRAGRRGGPDICECQSLGRPFRGLKYAESGKPAPDGMNCQFQATMLRPAMPLGDAPERYTLPAWPARWDAALQGRTV